MFKDGFLKFIKEKKDIMKIALVLALGLLLIFIGSKDRTNTESDEELEERVASICEAIDGVGECKVMIYYKNEAYSRSEEKAVDSVVIVCRGADSVEIRKSLTEMLSSLFGIGANRVRIEKMA